MKTSIKIPIQTLQVNILAQRRQPTTGREYWGLVDLWPPWDRQPQRLEYIISRWNRPVPTGWEGTMTNTDCHFSGMNRREEN